MTNALHTIGRNAHLGRFTRRTLAIAVTATLAACGGGGGGGTSGGGDPTPVADLTIYGSVGDGPVVQSQLTALDATGNVITTAESDATTRFQLTVPGDSRFPLTIQASGGTDLVTGAAPDFVMQAAVLDSSVETAHVSPFSTLIARSATAMAGGLTAENVGQARASITTQFNFGLDTDRIADPSSATLDEHATANLIKSSEALAEAIRRVRDTMAIVGADFTADEVIDVLAGDLSDGVLDGLGAGANARVAAVANVVAASVLTEAIVNQLHVGDADVTTLLDNAIRTVQPDGTIDTGDLAPTAPMLEQALTALAAAQAFAPSAELAALAGEVQTLLGERATAAATTRLPSFDTGLFRALLNQVVTASESSLEAINAVVRQRTGDTGGDSGGSTGGDTGGSTGGDTGGDTGGSTGGDTGGDTGGSTGGDSGPIQDSAPLAFNDSASAAAGTPAAIDVLANDRGLSDTPIQVQVAGQPANGSAEVGGDQRITYTANAGFQGQDTFTYRVTDADGDISIATVTVDVACASCLDRSLNLSWQPSSGATGYRVYFGTTTSGVTQPLAEVTATSASYSSKALGLNAGDNACFAVTAFNSAGESAAASPVCSTL